MTRRSRSDSGMSPATMRWARPSTIAVLPTPGSPMRTGLFFVRRLRTWMTRRISSSRPMTGSSLPSSASAVRSRPYFSSAWIVSSGDWSVIGFGRTSAIACSRRSRVTPLAASAWPAGPSSRVRASRTCSPETYWSFSPRSSRSALRRACSSSGAVVGSASEPSVGRSSRARSSSPRRALVATPSLPSTGATRPPSWSSRAVSRWVGVICEWRRLCASVTAACRASWVLIVKRSTCMDLSLAD